MKIHVLDDYQDTIRTLAAFAKVPGHQVTIWRGHTKEVEVLAGRLRDAKAIRLRRERTPIRPGGCSRDPASSDSLAFLS